MSTKTICINAMGVALFVALSMCLRVPVFENYYLCLGYIVMTLYCYSFGPGNGVIVGVMGTILYCFLIGGLNGLPGWALGNIIIGLSLGLWFKKIKKVHNILTKILTIIIVIISVAIGILGVKSIVECFLYSQPFWLRTTNNIYAFVADIFVIIASLPLCPIINKQIKKIDSNIIDC